MIRDELTIPLVKFLITVSNNPLKRIKEFFTIVYLNNNTIELVSKLKSCSPLKWTSFGVKGGPLSGVAREVVADVSLILVEILGYSYSKLLITNI